MLETAFAQLRLVTSIMLGKPFALWSLDWLIDALRDTQDEFGALGPEAVEFLKGPALDEETRHQFHLRRFRGQAVRAAKETSYYKRLFEQVGFDPARLRYQDILNIPTTPKEALRTEPEAFVRYRAQPIFGARTAGLTGRPGRVYFSEYEFRLLVALTTIDLLLKGEAGTDDVVQICYPAQAVHLNLNFSQAYARLGALVQLIGQAEPTHTLALLTQKRHLVGKKSRPSILLAYPSYLGKLVECGLRLGCQPNDFGLERIVTTGEMVTEGLKLRCQHLFGPVQFTENYLVTATLPFSGVSCTGGGLQFEPLHGLLEVINPETSAPALPGETGTIVITPFPSYRDTTLLLRYDTQDLVRLAEPFMHTFTSNILGKLNHSVQHEQGWTYPRQVQEALEAIEEIPLPARYGFWGVPGGVAIEVLVRKILSSVRHKIEQSLIEQGVPLRELYLVEDPKQLRRPIPVCCDIPETSFNSTYAQELASAMNRTIEDKSKYLPEAELPLKLELSQ